jgi:hypothetical protein
LRAARRQHVGLGAHRAAQQPHQARLAEIGDDPVAPFNESRQPDHPALADVVFCCRCSSDKSVE